MVATYVHVTFAFWHTHRPPQSRRTLWGAFVPTTTGVEGTPLMIISFSLLHKDVYRKTVKWGICY
ncbi:hypothetical protein F4861DRAFT_536407 [Xylaria intraflava]|nr:hypothetical protein F4861DRAFT_536407 [Xylaria intraflava]